MSDRAVLAYDTYIVEIHFEKGYDNCAHCPLLETYSRNMCRRTGEYIGDTRGRGMWCPLIKKEGNNEFEFSDAESIGD